MNVKVKIKTSPVNISEDHEFYYTLHDLIKEYIEDSINASVNFNLVESKDICSVFSKILSADLDVKIVVKSFMVNPTYNLYEQHFMFLIELTEETLKSYFGNDTTDLSSLIDSCFK